MQTRQSYEGSLDYQSRFLYENIVLITNTVEPGQLGHKY